MDTKNQEERNEVAFEKPSRGRKVPRAGLEESVDNLTKIHEQIGSGPFGRDSIAEALGYTSSNGTSNAKIGALTHFGLLERSGGAYRVSELGIGILVPTDAEERRRCIAKAVLEPSVYHELYAEYSGGAVPKMLANLMHRRFGMSVRAAEAAAALFCDAMDFAGLLRNGILLAEPAEERRPDPLPSVTPESGDAVSSSVAQSPKESLNVSSYQIPLTGNRVGTLDLPVGLCQSDIDRIKGWLDLMQDVLTEPGEPETPGQLETSTIS